MSPGRRPARRDPAGDEPAGLSGYAALIIGHDGEQQWTAGFPLAPDSVR